MSKLTSYLATLHCCHSYWSAGTLLHPAIVIGQRCDASIQLCPQRLTPVNLGAGTAPSLPTVVLVSRCAAPLLPPWFDRAAPPLPTDVLASRRCCSTLAPVVLPDGPAPYPQHVLGSRWRCSIRSSPHAAKDGRSGRALRAPQLCWSGPARPHMRDVVISKPAGVPVCRHHLA